MSATTPIRGTETKTRATTAPSTFIATPVFDGAHWDEEDEAGKHPTIKKILTNLRPDGIDGERLIGADGKAQLFNGRTGERLRPARHRRVHVHPEARPPGGRQDPRPRAPARTR